MTRTVLLADDSVTIHRVVELTFAREDVRVITVTDGDQAIEAIRRAVPDMVLADIDMPGRSGFDVAQFVRSQAATASVPVLLLAGAFETIDQAQLHQAGADGILTKPFDPAVLVSRVMELLTRGRGPSSAGQVLPPSPSDVFRSARALGGLRILEPTPAAAADAVVADAPVPGVTGPAPVVPDADVVDAPAAGDYFDQIDQAFAALSKSPRPPAPEDEDELPPLDDEPLPPVSIAAPRAVPLTDAFAALLDAERAGQPDPVLRADPMLRVVPAPPAAHVAAPAAAPAIDLDALADQIASRVLAQLSDRIVRETVVDITSATAERLVREEIERIKRNIK